MNEHDFAKLRKHFFDGYLNNHPEEATTLGVSGCAGRLRSHSAAALAKELAFFQLMGDKLAAVSMQGLGQPHQHDLLVMRRITGYHLHVWGGLWQKVDWSSYPYTMIQLQLAQLLRQPADAQDPGSRRQSAADWQDVTSRLEALPTFLEEHQENVLAGIEAGRRPDSKLVEFLADIQLAGAIGYFEQQVAKLPVQLGCGLDDVAEQALEQACKDAVIAYRKHCTFLRKQVLPNCSESFALGDDEVCWQLKNVFGIERSPSELSRRARANLDRIQEQFVTLARKLVKEGDVVWTQPIDDLAGARALAMSLQRSRPNDDAEVIPLYADLSQRALAFAQERGLFHMPNDYCIPFAELPPGMKEMAHAGNWPAPLMDRGAVGHFAVAPEASRHSLAWAADLAVHEGFPGHHLQSVCFQQAHGADEAPVRFLLVHDHVALPRHYWGAMLNIEGYAVYSEELMRKEGFFSPFEELFVLLAHAVRAARVVVDLGLHCETMTPPQAQAFMHEQVCLPKHLAKLEVRRYMQIPLQAVTYLLGRLAIEDLVQALRARDGDSFDLADFHRDFFAFGPLYPASIAEAMLGGLSS